MSADLTTEELIELLFPAGLAEFDAGDPEAAWLSMIRYVESLQPPPGEPVDEFDRLARRLYSRLVDATVVAQESPSWATSMALVHAAAALRDFCTRSELRDAIIGWRNVSLGRPAKLPAPEKLRQEADALCKRLGIADGEAYRRLAERYGGSWRTIAEKVQADRRATP